MADHVGHGQRVNRGHGGRGRGGGRGGRVNRQADDEVHGREEAAGGNAPLELNARRHRIGFNKLQEFLQRDPSDLLDDITTQRSQFPAALNDDELLCKPDCMRDVLAVIARALGSEQVNSAAVIQLLNIVRQSTLMERHLSAYLSTLSLNETTGPRLRATRQSFKDMLFLLKSLMTRMPSDMTSYMPCLAMIDFSVRGLRTTSTIINLEIERRTKT